MVADAQPRVTAADVLLPATAVAIRRRVATAVDPRTVAARRTAVVRRTAVARRMVADRTVEAVAADMGGNPALGSFPA